MEPQIRAHITAELRLRVVDGSNTATHVRISKAKFYS